MLTLQIKEKEIKNLTPEEEFIRGTVGAKCQINFDEFWQGYEKYIVFKRVGYEPINIMVDSLENEIEIPYTILAEIGEFKIGVFGITETETLPTLYSKDIKILYGTDTHGTTPPTYTPSEIDQLRLLKQDKLVSGENIKTINGESVLGKGDIKVQAKIEVDQTYTPDSENAQSGKAVSEAVAIEHKRANNTFANALKSSKSGSAIRIDDISPVTHEMSVKISSDTVTDLTTVKVTRCGKNLLYNDTVISESTNPVKKKIWSGNLPAPFVFSEDLSQFTPTEGLASAATFRFKLADGTEKVIGKDYKYLLVTTGILKEIYFVNNAEGIGTIKCQLEIGKVKTDYEPYVGTDYTPNADGTVDGITSLYPNTTLMTDTDGVIIDCEYNKDINKFSGVDVDVPTKTSELINDSNFATQDYVDEEIANFDFIKIVTELPETGLVNRTYFVPKQDSATNDLYDEYMWVDGKWELITTKQIEVDLTEYVKHTDINQSYDPTSENAQSGKAVAEAIAPKLDNPNTEGEAGQILGLDTNLLLQWTNKENDFELIADITAEEDVTSFNIPLNGIVYSEFIFILCQPNLRPTESWVGLGLKNDTTNLGFLNNCLLMNSGGIDHKTILWYGKILPDNILPNLSSNGNSGGVFGFTGRHKNSLNYPINYFGDVSHNFATFFKNVKSEPVRLMKAEGTYFKFGANGLNELVDCPLLVGTRVILLGKRM